MTQRVTIIGLGHTGTSLALALTREGGPGLEVWGFDVDGNALRTARKSGAFSEATGDGPSALRGASLVVIATPLTQIRETLRMMGSHLDDGATVTDTGVVKGTVMEWAQRYLPKDVSFIGGHPIPSRQTRSDDPPSADRFRGGTYCLTLSASATNRAVEIVSGLAATAGARPLFMDPTEHDSYSAGTDQLPALLAALTVQATVGAAKGPELAQVASMIFETVTLPAWGSPDKIAAAVRANAAHVERWLGHFIEELTELRALAAESAEGGGDALEERLSVASGWRSAPIGWSAGRSRT
jgi:prephenate dehydrogenase